MIKKVETLANVAVIVTSVVLCTVLAKNYLFSSPKQSITAPSAAPVAPIANFAVSTIGPAWNKHFYTGD